jgi:hypothetical protein
MVTLSSGIWDGREFGAEPPMAALRYGNVGLELGEGFWANSWLMLAVRLNASPTDDISMLLPRSEVPANQRQAAF